MKIDLTCPVELWQYAMPGEENAECTFVMNNLSDKVVTSVQVTLHCFGADDELNFKQTERMQGLKAGVGERFSVVLLPSEWHDVQGVDLVIEKVWFDDATIWRRGNAALTYYTSNALQHGRALDELRFVAGKDAVGYPQMQDEVWVCVCGRANAHDSDRCCRCERRRDAVFASFNRDNVNHIIAAHEHKLAETARKAREENNLLQENQERQRAAKRRRRKLFLRWTGTLALLAAAAVAIVVWGIPFVQYNTAMDLLTDAHYDQAKATFSQLGDYRDAAEQALGCDYQKAVSLWEKGDAENMEQAETLLRELQAYADSAEKVKQVGYALGECYLTSGSYERAVEKFQALGDYQDSAEKVKESIYRQACHMMENGSYEAARVLLVSLNEYSDAAQKADKCTLCMAELEMKDENYPVAMQLLAPLTGTAAADVLINQCYYAMAEAALANGEYAEAGGLFLQAGDYADALDRANECLYTLAQEKRGAGEYKQAMELFLQISDYQDSLEQAMRCVYEQATELMENGELGSAVALFESITDYEDAQVQLDECRFQMSEQALVNGDTQQAERLLMSIADHKDVEKQLQKVRYQLAQEALEADDYEKALERYELLGSYKDSKTRVKQCRYAIANAALEAGKYEQAIKLFTELGTYKESVQKIKQCRYAIANAALEAGEYAKAISLFEQLGSYENSKKLAESAKLQQAMLARESGDIEAAITQLEALKGNADVKELLVTIRMEEAARLETEGDFEAAAQLYAAAGTEEADARYQTCQYKLAEQLLENGDLPAAAAAFHALKDYEDAAQRSEDCYNAYYGQVAQTARNLYAAGDHTGVIAALQGFEMNVLSKTYSDLPEIFANACAAIGDQLYAAGQPYEAIPYYQHANAGEKLNRRAYLILGEWESATGKTAVFRTDGTCDLMGEALCFRVSNFSLYTGETPEKMTITHKISVLDETGMSLRDQRDGGDVLYKLSRKGDFELPPMDIPVMEATPEPAPEPSVPAEPVQDEDLLVTEGTDGADE